MAIEDEDCSVSGLSQGSSEDNLAAFICLSRKSKMFRAKRRALLYVIFYDLIKENVVHGEISFRG
jgi:hypothetical protein